MKLRLRIILTSGATVRYLKTVEDEEAAASLLAALSASLVAAYSADIWHEDDFDDNQQFWIRTADIAAVEMGYWE